MNITDAIRDPEMGYVPFVVTRTVYTRKTTGTISQDATSAAMGTIHPASMEEIQMFPEEDRSETYIIIHTDFALSLGKDNGKIYTAPDRITWNEKDWRVVKVRDWSAFGYVKAIAVMLHE